MDPAPLDADARDGDASTDTGLFSVNPDVVNSFPEIEPHLHEAAQNLSGAFVRLVEGEAKLTGEEIAALAAVNDALAERYASSEKRMAAVTEFSTLLVASHAHIKPLLNQVDAIEQAVTDLEKLVHAMDDYTLALAQDFKEIYGSA